LINHVCDTKLRNKIEGTNEKKRKGKVYCKKKKIVFILKERCIPKIKKWFFLRMENIETELFRTITVFFFFF